MKNLKLVIILIVAMEILLSGCKKTEDNKNPENTNKTCYVKSIKGNSSLDFRFYYSNNLKSRMEVYYPNVGGEWEFDGSLNFEYNTNKQLTKLINRLSSNSTKTIELSYENNRVSSFDLFDSSDIGSKEYSFTVKYDYNAKGKIGKWTAFDKSDLEAPFAELNLRYNYEDLNEILLLEPNAEGVMTPRIQYLFVYDGLNLIDPYIPTFFLDEEIFYLLFNQANMKQPEIMVYYAYNELDDVWEYQEKFNFYNTYDTEGKLTNMKTKLGLLNVTWDCK